jgi:hypothetical protein
VNIAFAQAVRTMSRWGAGCKELVAAMEDAPRPAEPRPG